jgi:hypothetical protein
MRRWEYLIVKLHEFGSEEGEKKRHNEYWVSEYGMLSLLTRLGDEGWEAVCQIGRDLVMKRMVEAGAAAAVVDMKVIEAAKTSH